MQSPRSPQYRVNSEIGEVLQSGTVSEPSIPLRMALSSGLVLRMARNSNFRSLGKKGRVF
jgi:hypothetical protein